MTCWRASPESTTTPAVVREAVPVGNDTVRVDTTFPEVVSAAIPVRIPVPSSVTSPAEVRLAVAETLTAPASSTTPATVRDPVADAATVRVDSTYPEVVRVAVPVVSVPVAVSCTVPALTTEAVADREEVVERMPTGVLVRAAVADSVTVAFLATPAPAVRLAVPVGRVTVAVSTTVALVVSVPATAGRSGSNDPLGYSEPDGSG